MEFGQPEYRINEDSGLIQLEALFSNPASFDITIRVTNVDINSTAGKCCINMLVAVAHPWEYIEDSITHMCSYIHSYLPSYQPFHCTKLYHCLLFPNAKYITFSTKPIVYVTIHNNQQEHNDVIKTNEIIYVHEIMHDMTIII